MRQYARTSAAGPRHGLTGVVTGARIRPVHAADVELRVSVWSPTLPTGGAQIHRGLMGVGLWVRDLARCCRGTGETGCGRVLRLVVLLVWPGERTRSGRAAEGQRPWVRFLVR